MVLLKLLTIDDSVLLTEKISLDSGDVGEHGRWQRLKREVEKCPRNAEKALIMFLGDDIKLTGIKLYFSLDESQTL